MAVSLFAPYSPYEIDRAFNRSLISELGGFIEIYVNTPLENASSVMLKDYMHWLGKVN